MPRRRAPVRRRGNPTPPNEAPALQNAIINPPGVEEAREVEDFGRDKNIKNLLKTLQPKAFTGEGPDVPKILEEWIMSMEDYFTLAGYNNLAQGIMGRAKLEGPAKLWWKLNCQTLGVAESTQGWEDLKERLKERYLPLNYSTNKMNEFLSCTRRGRAVDVYYEDFVKLSRHAPLMSEEQKLSRFILGLEGKLADEVDSLRPVSLADALIRATSKLSSFLRGNFVGNYKRAAPNDPPVSCRMAKATFVPTPEQAKPPDPCPPRPVQVKALPVTQSGKPIQCFECKEWGHKKFNCPKAKLEASTHPPLPPQCKTFLSRNQGGQNHQAPGNPPRDATVNHVSVKEEMKMQAQVYAALDPSGYNHQFSILEVQGDHEGGIPDGTRTDLGCKGEGIAP